jgi:hypothetical protein
MNGRYTNKGLIGSSASVTTTSADSFISIKDTNSSEPMDIDPFKCKYNEKFTICSRRGNTEGKGGFDRHQ